MPLNARTVEVPAVENRAPAPRKALATNATVGVAPPGAPTGYSSVSEPERGAGRSDRFQGGGRPEAAVKKRETV